MTRRPADQPPRTKAAGVPSRFAPKAFLASPATVQALCNELATQSARRFADLPGIPWADVAASIVAEVRESGHDLISLDDSADHRQWQATWYHPLGTFSLLLSFRPPRSVEVTWQTDAATFSASA